ncbi:MAG TPA: hypothetical protein VKC35_03390 [Vicinamibacterales bacterium]|nr:hypothetical protein [Vicinamibacterales bacterium]
MKTVLLTALLLAAAAGSAVAQPPPAAAGAQTPSLGGLLSGAIPPEVSGFSMNIGEELKKVRAAMVDLSVPDSPAFTVLGLTPEEVARPTTARKLATSLLNGVDRNGVLQTGVAIDTLPYLALAGQLLTLDDYRKPSNYALRFLARAQVSVGTAKASDVNDKALRVGLGVRMTVFDRGDPRTDALLDQCFDDRPGLPAAPQFVPPPPPDTPGEVTEWMQDVERGRQALQTFQADVDSYVTRVNAVVAECREQARIRNWNASKLIVAVAPTWTSPTGSSDDLGRSGSGIWGTLAYGFEHVPGLQRNAQLLAHARWRSDEPVPTAKDPNVFEPRDSRLLGVQLRAGTANATIAGEGIDERVTPPTGAATTTRRYSIGFERRVADNLWLGVAMGSGKSPAAGQKKGAFVLSSLKWGFAEGPSLKME